MVHKTWKVALIVMLGIFLFVPDLFAFPVYGYVDPGYNPGSTTQGVATYSFKNTGNDPGKLMQINLSFWGDVFDLDHTAPVIGSQTPGWILSPLTPIPWSPDDKTLTSFAFMFHPAFGINTGDTLSFQVNYSLLDDAPNLNWGEGGAWNQQWNGKYLVVMDGDPLLGEVGGSTAPIPEPATMLLFGISLLSVAGYGRYRLNRE